MMVYIVLLVSWVLYTLIEGYREGYYWHYKMHTLDNSETHETDLHPIFTIQRGVVSVLIFFTLTMILNVWGSILFMIGNTLIFSYLHNGSMYLTRKKLSMKMFPNDESKWIYTKGWSAMSSSSTAKLTKFMTPTNRLILFILGLICYIYIYITYINIW